MKYDVKVPEAGESISEGVLIGWFRQDGQLVAKDDPLFEFETDKITMKVDADAAGRLDIAVEAGSTVQVGQVVATIDTEAHGVSDTVSDGAPDAVSDGESRSSDGAPGTHADRTSDAAEGRASAAGADSASFDAPAEAFAGSADAKTPPVREPRLTRTEAPKARQDARAAALGPPKVDAPVPAVSPDATRETRTPMSSLRRRVAERLVQAQQTAAILTTFNEADMSALLDLRARHKERFAQQYGVKLGLMSFFVKAVVHALRQVPTMNARIDGAEIVQNHYYNIGVAVSTQRGLVVPVVRDADRLGFGEIEIQIADLADRAGEGTLEITDLQGGCFTISNGGVFGSMLSTPIINPPQCGILGMHAIKKRPMVVGPHDEVVVRPMMYLALSYDHRLIDGREAVTFLKHVVELIEGPERLLVGV